eukprot:6475106-Alexandrium_andersonii.AAC.1
MPALSRPQPRPQWPDGWGRRRGSPPCSTYQASVGRRSCGSFPKGRAVKGLTAAVLSSFYCSSCCSSAPAAAPAAYMAVCKG